jgi:hypothetical protein
MNSLVRMQVFYEIAMELGAEGDLAATAKKGLAAYLHKLGCLAGAVMLADHTPGDGRLTPVAVTPRNLAWDHIFGEEKLRLRERIKEKGLKNFLAELPVTGTVKDGNFYLMQLKDFGALMLIKSGEPFDRAELHAIGRLNHKFALVCLAGLYTDRLEATVQERTRALQETNKKLTESLANVRTLSGLLPICAGCKKIRDDKGYWNQIELYVRDHTNAEFTHGLCPACIKKYYPEYSEENGDKKEKPS